MDDPFYITDEEFRDFHVTHGFLQGVGEMVADASRDPVTQAALGIVRDRWRRAIVAAIRFSGELADAMRAEYGPDVRGWPPARGLAPDVPIRRATARRFYHARDRLLEVMAADMIDNDDPFGADDCNLAVPGYIHAAIRVTYRRTARFARESGGMVDQLGRDAAARIIRRDLLAGANPAFRGHSAGTVESAVARYARILDHELRKQGLMDGPRQYWPVHWGPEPLGAWR